jgi:hypothetical protein
MWPLKMGSKLIHKCGLEEGMIFGKEFPKFNHIE